MKENNNIKIIYIFSLITLGSVFLLFLLPDFTTPIGQAGEFIEDQPKTAKPNLYMIGTILVLIGGIFTFFYINETRK